jgi:tetratricopeptide (TPR) repeat protein
MRKIKVIIICLCSLIVYSGCLEGKKAPNEIMMRGLDFMVREEYDKAIKEFSDVLKEDQNNTSALYYRGVASYRKGDNAAGISDFDKLYAVDRDFNFESGYLWNIITNCYGVRKDYPKAIEMCLFFIKKYPDADSLRMAYNVIAQSYLRLKEFDKAIEGFQKVIELAEKGKSRRDMKLVIDSKSSIGFIKDNSDYDRKPLIMFSDIQNETDPIKKIEAAKKLLELYPKSSLADEVQYQIARLYSVDGLNDFDQAKKEYELFLKNYPQSPLVKQVQNSILGITEKYDPAEGKLRGSIH